MKKTEKGAHFFKENVVTKQNNTESAPFFRQDLSLDHIEESDKLVMRLLFLQQRK